MSEEIYLLRILQTLLQRPNLAYLWADADLQVQYASPQAVKLLGVETLKGHSLAEICPELVGVEDLLKDLAVARKPPFFLRHINRDMPSGETRYFSLTIYPPLTEHPDGLVILLEDTTAAGRLLQELNQSRNSLRLVQRQLEEANRFKSLSLAIASHEIGGRLGMMLGYTDLLELEKDVSPQAREMLNIIRWGIHSLTMSLRQLISLDQIERGQLVLDKHTCDLNALARRAWKVYLLPVKGQFTLQQVLPSQPVFVWGDENRLHQVLYNLISNAVKYTPEGERITLGLESAAEEARLWVENTGSGITPEDQQSLFRPYFRTTNQARRHKQGSGLGLFIVRQIVEAHGGRVEVVSDGESFVRFTVCLPLDHPETRLADCDPEEDAPQTPPD